MKALDMRRKTNLRACSTRTTVETVVKSQKEHSARIPVHIGRLRSFSDTRTSNAEALYTVQRQCVNTFRTGHLCPLQRSVLFSS